VKIHRLRKFSTHFSQKRERWGTLESQVFSKVCAVSDSSDPGDFGHHSVPGD
jgi:hypothetical protein